MLTDDKGRKRFYGVYSGTVASNKDPLNRRRLKLIVPQVLGTKEVTNWAWPVSPPGQRNDSPEVGQGVWVMFESGDPGAPLWVGVGGSAVDSGKRALLTHYTGTVHELFVTATGPDKVVEIKVLETLKAMADKIDELEGRIEFLESRDHTHA